MPDQEAIEGSLTFCQAMPDLATTSAHCSAFTLLSGAAAAVCCARRPVLSLAALRCSGRCFPKTALPRFADLVGSCVSAAGAAAGTAALG